MAERATRQGPGLCQESRREGERLCAEPCWFQNNLLTAQISARRVFSRQAPSQSDARQRPGLRHRNNEKGVNLGTSTSAQRVPSWPPPFQQGFPKEVGALGHGGGVVDVDVGQRFDFLLS